MHDDSALMPPPEPLPLRRQTAFNDCVQVDKEMTLRYTQFDCKYRACKYDNKTWGEIAFEDYEHFLFLMSYEVSAESNTFTALSPLLKERDLDKATNAIRNRDTEDGIENTKNVFLALICKHKGRMHNKSWREVRSQNYSYFIWAVGNTMSRDTRSYNVFHSCLMTEHQELVSCTTKGSVEVPRNLKYQEVVKK
jgi:hypothetical protein